MSQFLQFVGANEIRASSAEIEAAKECLVRFTAAFNACDPIAMDHELHFPHILCSSAECVIWQVPGQHPQDLFVQLKSSGWACTMYESVEPVLTAPEKVHFLVKYTRRNTTGAVLSEHRNIWVAVNRQGKWGILIRSY
ncbi:MAG: hypothetical protein M0T84_17665 [Betaproteobacteria bacterium]|nr:hypothetical protein [Betaproteobacteria bacterium]